MHTDTAVLLVNGGTHKLVALMKSSTRWNKIVIDTNSSDIYPRLFIYLQITSTDIISGLVYLIGRKSSTCIEANIVCYIYILTV